MLAPHGPRPETARYPHRGARNEGGQPRVVVHARVGRALSRASAHATVGARAPREATRKELSAARLAEKNRLTLSALRARGSSSGALRRDGSCAFHARA